MPVTIKHVFCTDVSHKSFMGETLFISDLHLHETRPTTSVAFFRFLEQEAHKASTLYILGDLFEYWLGDDQLDHDPLSMQVCLAIARLADANVPVFLMHGNRDFLIGQRFAELARISLIGDPTRITIGERNCLLMHGDTLCTDDINYQQFRKQARDPAWQASILAMPYAERVTFAQNIREQSNTEKAAKPENIMDVTIGTVESVFREHGYIDIIHGHTHRPARHTHMVDEHECKRHVLSDWRDDTVPKQPLLIDGAA